MLNLVCVCGRNDPTPDRGQQLPRAASLIVSSLGFIHDLRAGMLEPDSVRGIPLDMDQYSRLFGTARIPTEVRFFPSVTHIVTICSSFALAERMQDGGALGGEACSRAPPRTVLYGTSSLLMTTSVN